MVEGAALEMLFGGDFNEGSNPSLSVLYYFLMPRNNPAIGGGEFDPLRD